MFSWCGNDELSSPMGWPRVKVWLPVKVNLGEIIAQEGVPLCSSAMDSKQLDDYNKATWLSGLGLRPNQIYLYVMVWAQAQPYSSLYDGSGSCLIEFIFIWWFELRPNRVHIYMMVRAQDQPNSSAPLGPSDGSRWDGMDPRSDRFQPEHEVGVYGCFGKIYMLLYHILPM